LILGGRPIRPAFALQPILGGRPIRPAFALQPILGGRPIRPAFALAGRLSAQGRMCSPITDFVRT
jgi:hypothetical protein